jgi:type IV pilus assembly protein PilA
MALFCAQCGNSIADDEKFCRACGQPAPASGVAAANPLPVPPAGPVQTSTKAVVSLVCGLLFFVPLAFIAAVVFGHLALSEIKKSAGRLKGEGMAIAGLVLGYIWLAGIPIILIIAAIAIPNLLRARMAANESSAVASIRTLMVAEITYNSMYPNEGFTCSLSDLDGAAGGAQDEHHAMLIDSNLASGEKSGYRFDLRDCAADTGTAKTKFWIVAYPQVRNQTGVRAFCANEDAVVRVATNGSVQDCVTNGSPLNQ